METLAVRNENTRSPYAVDKRHVNGGREVGRGEDQHVFMTSQTVELRQQRIDGTDAVTRLRAGQRRLEREE
jgi:hypothetical protein